MPTACGSVAEAEVAAHWILLLVVPILALHLQFVDAVHPWKNALREKLPVANAAGRAMVCITGGKPAKNGRRKFTPGLFGRQAATHELRKRQWEACRYSDIYIRRIRKQAWKGSIQWLQQMQTACK